MKKILPLITAALVFFGPAMNVCMAQQSDNSTSEYDEDEMDDLDDLFADAEDVEDAKETEPVVQTASSSGSVIKFNGSVSASLGLLTQITPSFDPTPYASFDSSLGFTATPSNKLTVKGKATVSFPAMNIKLSTLYLDYVLLDKAYVSVGRTNTSWGNSQIFDTNILDDKKNDTYFSSKTFLSGVSNNGSDYFNAIVTVPVKAGQIVALGSYESTSATLSKKNMGAAFSVEYPIFGFSVNLFGKYFSQTVADQQKAPALGLEVTGDILDWHLTMWGQINEDFSAMKTEYARAVCGISRLWQANPRMVLVAEYQFLYDNQENQNEIRNDIGVKWAWSHVNGSQFSPSLQAYMNISQLNGMVVPGVTYTGLKHTTVTFTAPVLFGDQTLSYNGAEITSTKGMPTILLGLVVSIGASF